MRAGPGSLILFKTTVSAPHILPLSGTSHLRQCQVMDLLAWAMFVSSILQTTSTATRWARPSRRTSRRTGTRRTFSSWCWRTRWVRYSLSLSLSLSIYLSIYLSIIHPSIYLSISITLFIQIREIRHTYLQFSKKITANFITLFYINFRIVPS